MLILWPNRWSRRLYSRWPPLADHAESTYSTWRRICLGSEVLSSTSFYILRFLHRYTIRITAFLCFALLFSANLLMRTRPPAIRPARTPMVKGLKVAFSDLPFNLCLVAYVHSSIKCASSQILIASSVFITGLGLFFPCTLPTPGCFLVLISPSQLSWAICIFTWYPSKFNTIYSERTAYIISTDGGVGHIGWHSVSACLILWIWYYFWENCAGDSGRPLWHTEWCALYYQATPLRPLYLTHVHFYTRYFVVMLAYTIVGGGLIFLMSRADTVGGFLAFTLLYGPCGGVRE